MENRKMQARSLLLFLRVQYSLKKRKICQFGRRILSLSMIHCNCRRQMRFFTFGRQNGKAK